VVGLRGLKPETSLRASPHLNGSLGGNLIIIDDPIKLGDAMSESVRTRVIEWYRSTLLSRADDKKAARIILVMQRVHQDDLAGYLPFFGHFAIFGGCMHRLVPLPYRRERNRTLSHRRLDQWSLPVMTRYRTLNG